MDKKIDSVVRRLKRIHVVTELINNLKDGWSKDYWTIVLKSLEHNVTYDNSNYIIN